MINLTCVLVAALVQASSGLRLSKSISQESSSSNPDDERMKDLELVRHALTGDLLKTPLEDGAEFDQHSRDAVGGCSYCYSMMGNVRMNNVQDLLLKVLEARVPGDVVETGVWRGGGTILMKRILDLFAAKEGRHTYACDSFEGLPQAVSDHDDNWWHNNHWFNAGLDDVKDNFRRFNVLDESVHFVKGYFTDTLPSLKREMEQKGRRIALLRGDGDMYASYTHILYNLYPLLSVGGYFICDDCPKIKAAMDAVSEFREAHSIDDPMISVNGSDYGMFWRKSTNVNVDMGRYEEWRKANPGA